MTIQAIGLSDFVRICYNQSHETAIGKRSRPPFQLVRRRNPCMNTFFFILFTALAAASLAYGILICLAASGTAFFLVWFALSAIFALCAVSSKLSLWPRTPVGLRAVIIAAISAAAVVIAVTWGCILSEFHAAGEPDLNYIIVLGAQVRSSGPSNVLKYRLDKAAGYLKENPGTICIVSGGQGAGEPASEASVMKEYLESCGIDKDRILTEDKSQNTHQNIVFSARLCDPQADRIGIVTNNFHVFRAVHLAKKAGYSDVSGIAAPINPLYLLNNMLRETMGICKDFLCGNLS